MIYLDQVMTYCEIPQVKQLALYCATQIKQHPESTYAFVYAGCNGMQFEDENEQRYMELNISSHESGLSIRLYVVRFG